jgi:PilZ domain-containing protein
MAQETNEGVAYLRALKTSGGATAPAGAVPVETSPVKRSMANANPAPATGSQPLAVREKRRTPRYKLEGSAELRQEGYDLRTWATFSDISLHGCYVEATATLPEGTALQIKLEANGFRIETKGSVRVNYPSLGMGIAFTEMSEENRARLRQLLAKISPPSVIMAPSLASALPVSGPLKAVPPISDPSAALRALVEYFENRQMLTQEEFLRLLRTSQRGIPAPDNYSRF